MENIRLLIINPGSTSTKIGVFDNENMKFEETLRHSTEEISQFEKIYDQYEFRKEIIVEALKTNNISIDSLDGIVGRGGLLKPIEGGTYEVDDNMLKDLKVGVLGEHASNLGGILAYEIAKEIDKKAFIVDPVVVDEMEDIARISGLKHVERKSIFHALNQKAVARRHANEIGKKYEDLNLILVHLGGGVSVGAHKKGKVIDVANALDGEGPFSTERAGTLPSGELIKLCFSGNYTQDRIRKMIHGKGGLTAYLGTNDMIAISRWAEDGEEPARTVLDAMLYTVAKQIGAMFVAMDGEVDAIILTGGIAHSEYCTAEIIRRTKYLAPITVMPGEIEIESLAYNAYCLLNGKIEAKEY